MNHSAEIAALKARLRELEEKLSPKPPEPVQVEPDPRAEMIAAATRQVIEQAKREAADPGAWRVRQREAEEYEQAQRTAGLSDGRWRDPFGVIREADGTIAPADGVIAARRAELEEIHRVLVHQGPEKLLVADKPRYRFTTAEELARRAAATTEEE